MKVPYKMGSSHFPFQVGDLVTIVLHFYLNPNPDPTTDRVVSGRLTQIRLEGVTCQQENGDILEVSFHEIEAILPGDRTVVFRENRPRLH